MTFASDPFNLLSPGSSPTLFDDENEIQPFEKPKKGSRKGPGAADKRAQHNSVERARRESLNGRFLSLADSLPEMATVKRPSKSIIVNKALEFVCLAQVKEKALLEENGALRLEVNSLRAKLGMSPLPPPLPLPTVASPPSRDSPPTLAVQFQHSFTNVPTSDAINLRFDQGSDDGSSSLHSPMSVGDRRSSVLTPPSSVTSPLSTFGAVKEEIASPVSTSTSAHAHSLPTTHHDYLAGLQQQQHHSLPTYPSNFIPPATFDQYSHLAVQPQQQQQHHYGFPSTLQQQQQHAAMVSAAHQQATHQRLYQQSLLASAGSSSSGMMMNAYQPSMLSLSAPAGMVGGLGLSGYEHAPRSFVNLNEMASMGDEYNFGGMMESYTSGSYLA